MAPSGKKKQGSANHAGSAAGEGLFNFLARGHRGVARRGRRKRTVRRAVLDGLLGVVEFEETQWQTRRETVAAADSIEKLQTGILAALETFSIESAAATVSRPVCNLGSSNSTTPRRPSSTAR